MAAQLSLFPVPEPEHDAASDVPVLAPVRVQRGDLWQLGTHRLLCGDATSAEDVARLMGGVKAHLAVHDPPYGNQRMLQALGSGKRYGRAAAAKGKFKAIHGNDKPFDPKHLLHSGKTVVLWGGNHYADKLPASPAWLIWDKRGNMASNGYSDAEVAWVSRGNTIRLVRHRWNGMIRDSERREPRVHPTQKPVAVLSWVIEHYTDQRQRVADYYLGSGTTLIACERTKRRCYGMEIEPHYCDIILRRWEQMTGKRAVLIDRLSDAAQTA